MAYLLTGKNEDEEDRTLTRYVLSLFTSLLLSIFVILPLSSEDHISIYRGFCLFSLGLLFFSSLFSFINHIALKTAIGYRFKKKYQLTTYDLLDCSNKLVSSIQALLSCFSGLVVCTYSCSRSFLKTSHFASEAYAWFGTAYFLYDIWSMFIVHDSIDIDMKQNGDAALQSSISLQRNKSELRRFLNYIVTQPIIIGHHLFIGSFGFLVIVYLRGGLGDCTFGYIYLMELSTPFVSIRGILSRMGLKNSNFYVINGLIMIITFFFCRIAMFPYVCYLHSVAANMRFFEAILSLPRGCKIGITILLLPQFYWFWLMVKGAAKIFCAPNSKSISSPRKRRSANHNHS